LAGVFSVDESPDGRAIIKITQSFLYADTGKRVPVTGKPIASWVDTPGPELFFEYNKGPPASFQPITQEAAVSAIASIKGSVGTMTAEGSSAASVTNAAAPPAATVQQTTPAATPSNAPAASVRQTTPAAAPPNAPAATLVSATASDTIVLLNGNIIDAKIEEITPTEIKYRRADNLSGPLYTINKSEVLSIKYGNGTVEVINVQGQQAAKSKEPILRPGQMYVAFSFDPSGLISGGPSVSLELTKGHLISSFHASFPTLALNNKTKGFGFGFGMSFNYFWGGPIGGFYLGPLIEWNMYPFSYTAYNPYADYNPVTDTYTGKSVKGKTSSHSFVLAGNLGYKFVLRNGVYFRTGVAVGMRASTFFPASFYYKPDIAGGYIF